MDEKKSWVQQSFYCPSIPVLCRFVMWFFPHKTRYSPAEALVSTFPTCVLPNTLSKQTFFLRLAKLLLYKHHVLFITNFMHMWRGSRVWVRSVLPAQEVRPASTVGARRST